jgi:hypothetical protein
MQTFEKFFLGLNGLIFLALGASGLLAPVSHMAVFDVTLNGPSILAEIRANYGGMHLGMGMLFMLGTFAPSWRRAALLTLALFVGGLAAGRTLSLLVDGMPNNTVLAFIVIEWLGLALAVWLLRPHLRTAAA